ncbi:MAG: (2Fe-2S)-binding protein [Acidimicrobiales bacterium]|nr:MAG: (2Fe-2S)-binding protein [Acidimicrobiales bacterium]
MPGPWTSDEFWAGTRAPLTSATGLQPEAYTSEDFFADERTRLFGRGWVAVGTAPEIADSGRLLVRAVGERSILVTRDGDGVLRAFLNSCRHRGTELADADCDVAGTIRCPYHRWGYGLDGTLVATPFLDDVPRDEFAAADHGLVPVRVDTWGPLVFACLADDTPPLEEWLGDLPERMAGYRFQDWRVEESRTIDIAANWKLITENFQEYYHLTWVHPELAKVSRVKDHYRYQGPGMYCGQTTSPVSGDDRDDWLVLAPAAGLDASDAVSGRFVAVFPNVMLAVLPNHVFLIVLEPVAPGRTREHCSFLLPPSTAPLADGDLDTTRTFWLDVNDEDIDIVERGQRGLHRGHVPPGPLVPRFEEPLHRFHRMVADCMTTPSLADVVVPDGDDGSPASRLGTGVNPHPPSIDRAEPRKH